MVKGKTGDLEVPGSIPGRCNSFVCVFFFCSFYLSVLFSFLSSMKREKAKGIHMLLDNMSSLKIRGLCHSQ